MNGFFLLIPFLLIRFGLLGRLDRRAVGRAAYFAPVVGKEVGAYWVYQVSNVAILVYLCFLNVSVDGSGQFLAGAGVYLMGLALLAVSMVNFAVPDRDGLNRNGLYRFSRNPMYVAYFVYYMGCALLTRSWVLGGIVAVFQISAHWIILAEERWCVETFGDEYRQYMREVRRYF